ncbi:MAG: hypothetical protein CfP315_0570 [Candidatus Improbicoccus pseudotrichonymphae]|uniref:Uncharacterized protein n=1 Tax=Candidatus Improbicoccus pseudotrichonymphae TaxID=3033792 RepID=A0AA48I313_9FIRM|nr:MAG: hypothetical protein CfP315_0570 [Candidatus Improbicoccus pseudotrichonymphae]
MSYGTKDSCYKGKFDEKETTSLLKGFFDKEKNNLRPSLGGIRDDKRGRKFKLNAGAKSGIFALVLIIFAEVGVIFNRNNNQKKTNKDNSFDEGKFDEGESET